ncbi:MAG: hypothetical protein ACI392_01545 [Paludibacteraceae bacterium]
MRKIATLCLIALSLSLAHAEVLLVENFDYTAGTPLTSCGWTATYGGTSTTAITNGLSFDDYAGCGIGNGALISGTDNSAQPHKAFTKQTSGSVYVAFMLQPYMVSTQSYFFSLRDAISTSTFNFVGRIYLNEQNQIGLSFYKSSEVTPVFGTQVLDNETVYLVVLKYTIIDGDKNDRIDLYLLDAYTATEPTTPLLSVTNTTSCADICPENIVLRSNSDDDWIVVDGIRVATTWSEAVAAGACPATGTTHPTANYASYYTTPNTLHLQLTADDTIFIYDTTGKCVCHEHLTAGTYKFDLRKGFYVLKTATQTHKIIIS